MAVKIHLKMTCCGCKIILLVSTFYLINVYAIVMTHWMISCSRCCSFRTELIVVHLKQHHDPGGLKAYHNHRSVISEKRKVRGHIDY